MKFFISALAGLILSVSTAQAQYFEAYGGTSVGGQQLNYGPVPPSSPNLQAMDSGLVVGGGYYVGVPTTNLQIGADLMLTNQDYSTWGPGSNLSSTSLMVNARIQPPAWQLNNINFYGGIGLGAILLDYDDPAAFLDGTDTIAGYQLELGATYQLGLYTTFTAIKYQAGFDEGTIQSESVEYNSLSVLGGIRF